jgi:hypothetical protein
VHTCNDDILLVVPCAEVNLKPSITARGSKANEIEVTFL